MSKLLNNLAINDQVLEAVTAFVKNTRNADRTIQRERGAVISILMDNGVMPTDLVSPNKGGTATQEEYDSIRMHIKVGFHDDAQKILNMPSKKVPDGIEGIDWKWTVKTHNGEDKLTKKFMPRPMGKDKGTGPHCENARFAVTRGNRNYWQAQIGSKMNDLKDGLDRRYKRQHQEEVAKEGKGKEAKGEPKVAKVDTNAADIKYFRSVAETGIKRIQKNEAPSYKVAKVQKALNDLLAAMVEAEQA